MIAEEKLRKFVNELEALTYKYDIVIDGNWDPPFLLDLNDIDYQDSSIKCLDFNLKTKRYEIL